MINWFLGRVESADPDTLRVARMVVIFSLLTSVGAIVFSPITYQFGGPIPGIFIAVIVPLMALSALLLRWSGSIALATQSYLASLWLLLTGFALLMGGLNSPSYAAYAMVILGASFLGGRRSGTVWTVISIATVLVLWLVRGRFVEMAEISDDDLEVLMTLAALTVLVFVGFYALQYDRATTSAFDELHQANQRTAQMIEQLEQASKRLVFSSERFLGSSEQADPGLVGQIMEKARDGRAVMEMSRHSMDGMIEQYHNITERVQSLHEHSRVIVDIVDTIDRISDRLDLMALNVGIEAAHGGESGKQFAILARDMRLLAERVVNETRQIKQALRKVHEQVRDVLDSSLSGRALTEESAARMASMIATFDDIYELIEEAEGATSEVTNDTLLQIDAVRRLVSAASTQHPS